MKSIYLHLEKSATAAVALYDDQYAMGVLGKVADLITNAFARGNKLLIVGNGGSAGDAQHIAAEFVGAYKDRERKPLPAIALTTDTSALTAIGNDFGFGSVFARQVQALGRPGDVLWALSTSGRSDNVIRALSMARAMEMNTVGFTGGVQVNPMMHQSYCHLLFAPPAEDTAVIQQLHMIAAHAICGAVEARIKDG